MAKKKFGGLKIQFTVNNTGFQCDFDITLGSKSHTGTTCYDLASEQECKLLAALLLSLADRDWENSLNVIAELLKSKLGIKGDDNAKK